jgi:hypothetical protein
MSAPSPLFLGAKADMTDLCSIEANSASRPLAHPEDRLAWWNRLLHRDIFATAAQKMRFDQEPILTAAGAHWSMPNSPAVAGALHRGSKSGKRARADQ